MNKEINISPGQIWNVKNNHILILDDKVALLDGGQFIILAIYIPDRGTSIVSIQVNSVEKYDVLYKDIINNCEIDYLL